MPCVATPEYSLKILLDTIVPWRLYHSSAPPAKWAPAFVPSQLRLGRTTNI